MDKPADARTTGSAETPRILVIGAGAVGQYLGARLVAAGHDVTFLARPATAEGLRARGLVLRDVPGGTTTHLNPIVVTPDELATAQAAATTRPFDVVVVTVKAPGLEWAADALRVPGVVDPETSVVPLLNGLAQIDVLAAAAAASGAPGAVLGATVRIVVSLDAEGVVVLHQPIHRITLGALDGEQSRAARAAAALAVAGLDIDVTDDAEGELWDKWSFIVASGVLGVLARGTVGQIVATPDGAAIAERVIAETSAVAAAAGHPIDEAALQFSRTVLTTSGSGFVSSLYRDVVAGRAGESEHIVGDFVRRARELNVATPLCDVALLQMRVVTAS